MHALFSGTNLWLALSRRHGHAGRGGLPHEINLRRGQGVGLVDEVAEGALQFQGFGGEGAGGVDGAGVLVTQRVDAGGGQRLFLAPDALDFTLRGAGIEFGYNERLSIPVPVSPLKCQLARPELLGCIF